MFNTVINGLCGVENGGMATKISTLAHLVSEIWSFYPFWGGGWDPFIAIQGANYRLITIVSYN